jgi:hypothetical protein
VAAPDPLAALRDRLAATEEAARRLADEARAEAGRPPAAGWDVPRAADRANDELDALVHLLTTLRDTLPPELRAQLADLVRQLLVFVRAVLDWWIGRLEQGRAGAPPPAPADGFEDIPLS